MDPILSDFLRSEALRGHVSLSEAEPPARKVLPHIDAPILAAQPPVQGVLAEQGVGEVSNLFHRATVGGSQRSIQERETGIHEYGRRCQACPVLKVLFKDRRWGDQVLIIRLFFCIQGRRWRRVWLQGCKFLGLGRSGRRWWTPICSCNCGSWIIKKAHQTPHHQSREDSPSTSVSPSGGGGGASSSSLEPSDSMPGVEFLPWTKDKIHLLRRQWCSENLTKQRQEAGQALSRVGRLIVSSFTAFPFFSLLFWLDVTQEEVAGSGLQKVSQREENQWERLGCRELAACQDGSLQCARILGLKTRLQIACTSRLPSVANQLEIYAPAVLLLTL